MVIEALPLRSQKASFSFGLLDAANFYDNHHVALRRKFPGYLRPL